MGPRERILIVATKLFYEQGYVNTGINQIIQESKTAKASFYDYYPSKDILGRAVLRKFCADVLFWLRQILRKSKTPDLFAKNLCSAIKKQIKEEKGFYQGCPIALFCAQLPSENDFFKQDFKEFVKIWETISNKYFLELRKNKKLNPTLKIPDLTRRVFNLYEGALIMWKLSEDINYINQLETDLNKVFNS
ncbi:MAG TPA: TetR/AcrR family transcriptional regulator [Leptospiraceae bacterium]|nr:TetR/AcrR family transcriptional regulator [Leptospiraceae bacterium]HMX33532.1 TetR/AcrR family transcriptional regulator [Leptospiraceae bacterium]HMY32031.1 TetR/AcrR family transcriptional regulator [Leptospiraceae bacterium]HMZ67024.1 TetR/AcrR family transcriptional regulator [Leptospiraceae bacterium]HNA07406.1 TetR/AcrR family transcriptional regulator [Leptospiraceae bacterium]